jgi:hypothetical protein
MVLKMMLHTAKESWHGLLESLSNILIKYFVVEKVLERATLSLCDKLLLEKKLVVVVSKER